MIKLASQSSLNWSAFFKDTAVCLAAVAFVVAVAVLGLIRFVPSPTAGSWDGSAVTAPSADTERIARARGPVSLANGPRPDFRLELAAEIDAAAQLGLADQRADEAERARSPLCRLALYCEAGALYGHVSASLTALDTCGVVCAEMLLKAASRQARIDKRMAVAARSIGCIAQENACNCPAKPDRTDCR